MQILNDIIDWVEEKPEFWQIAIDRLIRNNHLTARDIKDLIEICKTEKGLAKFTFTPVDFKQLRQFVSGIATSESVAITKILNIDNINALSSKNTLDFPQTGITVVYGDNGAGKSSYVSILKHICNTRGEKPTISNNLFDPTSASKDKKAEVEFVTDSKTFNTVKLLNSSISSDALKKIDVFDSLSANHYIANEDEIAFIPNGLSILEKFALALNQIENELGNEIQALNARQFNFSFLQLDSNSKAKKFIDSITEETSTNELDLNSNYNKSKEKRITEINKKIEELRRKDTSKTKKENEGKMERFSVIKRILEGYESYFFEENLVSIIEAFNDFIDKDATLRVASEKLFANESLKEIGSNEWRQLWESARRYYNKSTGDIFPPVTDGKLCPLCLQELDESAMQRFIGFEDFIKQDTQQQYNISNERNKQNIKEYESLTFDLINQEPIVKEISELIPEFQSTLDADLLILNGQKEQLINLLNQPNRINEGLKFQLSRQCITSIGQLIAQYSDENQKLSELPFESELIPLELELMELANEKKLSQFKPQISKEIDRRKELKMLNQCYSKCRTNAVTMFSNELASTYVGQSLRDNFQKELVGFGFVNIQIQTETRGARGKQYHYLKLNEITPTNASLKDILSEGEHRCIALSIFLSELTLADHKSAIIFDDPVSSLDHKWRKKIAKRIVEESRIRQVIVFTHDITFLLLVQEYADNFALTLTIKSLTRKKEETGIIAGNPPWDALSVNKRIGQLRSEHQRIDKIERTQTEEEYRENIKPLYGKLRETWERLVEEVLLNGAVQRFGRSIQTQRLSKVVDLQDSDYDIVELNMTKCSTYFNGHDSAGELIEVMPTSTEFLKDIQTIEDYVAEVRKRRK